jgi:hypothetical protein
LIDLLFKKKATIETNRNSFFSPFFTDLFGGYDILGVCLKNCAQCKKMFGNLFQGELCAKSCVKFKGKVIPDCEDLGKGIIYLLQTITVSNF